MDTSEILKELEGQESVPEQSKVQLDLSQLQGALILIQDTLANQQKLIIDLSRTTKGMNDSNHVAHRDLNNKIDTLPNSVNDTYSKAVCALTKATQDKLDNDNRIASSIINAQDTLLSIHEDLDEAVCTVLKAAKSVDSALDTTTNLYQRIYIDQWTHYLFLFVFVLWLAYARYQSWGNNFLILGVAVIIIWAIISIYRLK